MTDRRFIGAETLELLTDEEILAPPPELTAAPSVSYPWWERFEYHRYDWNDPAWNEQNVGASAWKPVLLNGGLFAMVSLHDYDRITAQSTQGKTAGLPRKWTRRISRGDDEITD